MSTDRGGTEMTTKVLSVKQSKPIRARKQPVTTMRTSGTVRLQYAAEKAAPPKPAEISSGSIKVTRRSGTWTL